MNNGIHWKSNLRYAQIAAIFCLTLSALQCFGMFFVVILCHKWQAVHNFHSNINRFMYLSVVIRHVLDIGRRIFDGLLDWKQCELNKLSSLSSKQIVTGIKCQHCLKVIANIDKSETKIKMSLMQWFMYKWVIKRSCVFYLQLWSKIYGTVFANIR